RRGPQVQLVRRLPARAPLPDAHRPLPPGPLRPRRVRLRDDRPGRRRGGVRQDGARRRAPLGGGALMSGEIRIDHTVTSGTFSLDGGTWEVDNNVWVLGDDTQCVVFDAPHDAGKIAEVVGDREVLAILCTHAHDDHVRAVPDLKAATGAPAYLHPDDRVLWDMTHDTPPDGELADGQVITVAGTEVRVLHTPGHSPGACCFHVPALGVVFTGDTL